jgi:hypothetical protein
VKGKVLIALMALVLASFAGFAQDAEEGGNDGNGQGQDRQTSTSNAAFDAPGGSIIDGGAFGGYATSFEASEGYSTGFLDGQEDWTVFAVSTQQPVITNARANTGSQSLRIDVDASIGAGNLTGGFSPQIVVADPMELSRASVDVFITGTGGADYDFAPQAPTQGFLTARVNFRFTGPIRILDGGVFVDTGVTWPVNQWMNIRVEVDPNAPQIDYYLDDALIYSTNVLVGGTTVEQVVLISDNFHFGEVGDFDDLDFSYGTPVFIPTLTEWGMIGFISLLAIAALVIMRRRNLATA